MKIKLALIGLLSLGLYVATAQSDSMPGTVASTEEAAAVMEERSEFMKTLGSSMKAFGGYVKRGDGEPLELASMAADIASNASKIPSLFPENTGIGGMVEDSESEASPEIWQNWSDFLAAAEALVEPATALAMALEAEESRKDLGKKVGALGRQGCKGCHDQFREKHDH